MKKYIDRESFIKELKELDKDELEKIEHRIAEDIINNYDHL